MATNHTTNYNLNLWEASDKFVREEFNENSTKIDAALKAEADARTAAVTAETAARAAAVQDLENRKAGFVLLKQADITGNTNRLELDVSSINWNAWQYVFLDVDAIGFGNYHLQLNSPARSFYSYSDSGTCQESIGGRINFTTEMNGGRRYQFDVCRAAHRSLYVTFHKGWGQASCKFEQVNTFIFVPENNRQDYYISPGSVIRVWGLA